MDNPISQARERYLPKGRIEVVFIAEAPPADPSRFFYFDQVDEHDWLYLALVRALFSDAREIEAKELRKQKPDYLERFRDQGYYLIDACDDPMPARASPVIKRRHLTASLDQLVNKVRNLVADGTRVVLISQSVYEVCYTRLQAEGFNVINSEMIDFPSSGRQQHFARKLHRDLHMSDQFLQATIRGLKASIDFFGAGDAKKWERERWIVETFLRALGLQFGLEEIERPSVDPPDVCFRGAAFEIKEILEAGRTRGDEYRQALAKATAAISHHELTESFAPQDLPITEAYRMILDQTHKLSENKYVSAVDRSSLDLLFYLNLGMATAWAIEDGARPDIASIVAEGWRSVSFLHGASTACVMYACNSAPEFIKRVEGRFITRGSVE